MCVCVWAGGGARWWWWWWGVRGWKRVEVVVNGSECDGLTADEAGLRHIRELVRPSVEE